MSVSVELIEPGLKQMVESLPLGETITLVQASGTPIAIVVSLSPSPTSPTPNEFSGNASAEALFKQRALATGLLRELKPIPAPLPESERRLLEVEGKSLSQVIIEERR